MKLHQVVNLDITFYMEYRYTDRTALTYGSTKLF